MVKSIKWRLATIYVILVVIVMILAGSLIVSQVSKNEYDSLEEDLSYTATLIIKQIDPSTDVDQDLEAVIDKLGAWFLDKSVYLLDNKGNVLFPVNSDVIFNYSNVMIALEGDQRNPIQKVQFKDGEYLSHAEPVISNGEVEYVVLVLASIKGINETMQGTVKVIVFAMLFAISMAGILGIIFSNFLTKPISILSQKARAMAAGNLDLSIEPASDDEIGDLTQNFNTMAASLKDTLDQISSEKNKLEIVFTYMTDGILLFDRVGLLTHYNPASVSMLNITTQATYKDIFSEYTDESFQSVYEKVLKGTIQHIIQVKDRYYNICMVKFLSQHETLADIICVIQDITEHKKLEQIQKEFVANVSHELRTPLTTIKSYTETLLDGAMEQKDIAENFLGVINHEADRMTALVQDLLDLSKLDNRQTNFKMKEFNLNQLLEDSLNKYMIHITKKNQTLTYEPGETVFFITGDQARVEQVIKNIISNAVKYSPEEAKISVRLFQKEEYVCVEVKDSGVGIPEADMPRIFERFYRVDKARSREMGGTGLGLSIAKEIMEFHGGKIELVSEFGKGSTFTILFPVRN